MVNQCQLSSQRQLKLLRSRRPAPGARRMSRGSCVSRPRATATQIKLNPDAVQAGFNFSRYMQVAMAKVDLARIGIIDGIRFKEARTGAKFFFVSFGVATHPHMCANLHLKGLDDFTAEEIPAAFAYLTSLRAYLNSWSGWFRCESPYSSQNPTDASAAWARAL